jgi:hypothetical protein
VSLRSPICNNSAPLDGFSWNLISDYFSKIHWENSSFIKIWQELRLLYMKTDTHFWSNSAHFFVEWEMFQIKVVEKIKTHVLCSVLFSRKSCRLWDNVDKYYRGWQATDDIMVHAHCVLDTHRAHARAHTHIHTQKMQYVLLSHRNNGCTNAPQCYVIRPLPASSYGEAETDIRVVLFELEIVFWQWSWVSGMLHRVAGLIIPNVSN